MKIIKTKMELAMAEMNFTVSDLANATGISPTGISTIIKPISELQAEKMQNPLPLVRLPRP